MIEGNEEKLVIDMTSCMETKIIFVRAVEGAWYNLNLVESVKVRESNDYNLFYIVGEGDKLPIDGIVLSHGYAIEDEAQEELDRKFS